MANTAKKDENAYWRELVTIRLFRDTGKYSNDVYVNVNDHNYVIKRGVDVRVPRFIAEVLRNSEEQDRNTALMIEQANSDYEDMVNNKVI